MGEGRKARGVEIVGVKAGFAELEEIGEGRSDFTGKLEMWKMKVVNLLW